ITTMTPPLAGSMKMRFVQFLQFDSLGVLFYVSAYSLAGFLFSDALRTITRGFRSAGSAAEIVLCIGLGAYVGYRIWLYHKYRLLDGVPRVAVEKLAQRLASEERANVIVAD